MKSAITRTSGRPTSSDLQPRASSLRPRPAFTLTELLVVIAIIAVLAGMVSVGVMRALDTAKQTRIKIEVDQLDMAFKAFREKYGSFPPCNLTNPNATGVVGQFVARAFPRYDITQLPADLNACGRDINFRPDQALVFWLRGFGPDPSHPFVNSAGAQINNGMPGSAVVVTPLFDFDKSRLVWVNSPAGNPNAGGPPTQIPSYFPQGSKTDSTGAPYVYWNSGAYTTLVPLAPNALMWNAPAPPPMTTNVTFTNAGGIRPYAFDGNGDGSLNNVLDMIDSWANPQSFQIIAAGGDGKYGVVPGAFTNPAKLYPTGTNYDPLGSDDDNVTNFCPKARLGDAKP